MNAAAFKAQLLTAPEQFAEYFSIFLETAVELAAQGRLTVEQLRQYRKQFSVKELADIEQELSSLPSA